MDGTLLMIILLLSFMSAKQRTGVLDAAEPGRPSSDYPTKHTELLLLEQPASNKLLPAAPSPLYAVSITATTQSLLSQQLMDCSTNVCSRWNCQQEHSEVVHFILYQLLPRC
jgi:hypothetical protein